MKERIAIALSGGVDSLVAAHILKQQGHDLIGIHFFTGFETLRPSTQHPAESSENIARKIAFRLSAELDIPVKVLDIQHEFRKTVVDYFTRTYQIGQTPNPCLVCNPKIKFGIVFDRAEKWGIHRLATGHYARISEDPSGTRHLHKGADPQKDQSYFLAFMTRTHLARACFPLEKMTKSSVQDLARENGLRPAFTEESQDVCFIRNKTYGEFLAAQEGFTPRPGVIENTAGKVIGEHGGLHLFTIGQRRGINCPAAHPYYVVRFDRERNVLVVGFKSELLAAACRVVDINWIEPPPADEIDVFTRVRYRHQAAASRLRPSGNSAATVRFDAPQEAVTPGQGAVFYQKDRVLGGGFIES